jgi:hypothetical protein
LRAELGTAIASEAGVERVGGPATTLLRCVALLMALFILLAAAFLVYTRVAG